MTAISTSPLRTLGLIAADIKLAHSVFAMPFALLAAFMAALGPTRGTWFVVADLNSPDPMEGYTHVYLHPDYRGQFWPPFLEQLALMLVAMVLARSAAMLANRLLDRAIDARNPRTAGRALPSGRLSLHAMFVAWLLACIGFIATCAAFGLVRPAFGVDDHNWWPLILSIPVLSWICVYGLLKRFTRWCHVYLGTSLALSPIAASIAITPESMVPWSPVFQPSLWLLSAMVLCWVAGFDIIYALQDVEIDRAQNLHSIPARLGVKRAMWISRTLHALSVACLFACWWTDPRLNILFGIGILIVTALLIYEHLTVARWGTTKIALAFFTLNGVISCVLGLLGIVDVLWT